MEQRTARDGRERDPPREHERTDDKGKDWTRADRASQPRQLCRINRTHTGGQNERRNDTTASRIANSTRAPNGETRRRPRNRPSKGSGKNWVERREREQRPEQRQHRAAQEHESMKKQTLGRSIEELDIDTRGMRRAEVPGLRSTVEENELPRKHGSTSFQER